VASTGPTCGDVQPPGPALGSWKVTNMSYTPGGPCTASGGQPTGSFVPTLRSTFCCLP
jgi:hypothetical protein